MTKPLTDAQKSWNNASYAPRKPSPKPKGKLQPRDSGRRIAPERYVPTCIACGNPRGRTFGLKCEFCEQKA